MHSEAELSKGVRRVASRILTASNLGFVKGERENKTPTNYAPWGPDKGWEVLVVDHPHIDNAMSGPGMHNSFFISIRRSEPQQVSS